MKKIIERPDQTEAVFVDNIYSHIGKDDIIAYVTSSKESGLAVSARTSDGEYGFYYHKDLIQDRRKAKFVADTKMNSLIKVLESGRELILFENFEEFLEFSIEHNKR